MLIVIIDYSISAQTNILHLLQVTFGRKKKVRVTTSMEMVNINDNYFLHFRELDMHCAFIISMEGNQTFVTNVKVGNHGDTAASSVLAEGFL